MSRSFSIVGKLDRAVGAGSYVLGVVGAVGTIGIAGLIIAYMFLREVIDPLLPGTQIWQFVEEWGGYLMVLISYFGMAYTLRLDEHIKVDIGVNRLPPRARAALEAFTTLLSLSAGVYLLMTAVDWFRYLVDYDIRSTAATLTPLYIPYLFLLVGLGWFLLALAMHLARKAIEARGTAERNERGGSQ